ncbi:4-(cytidine 5'-diphospho)-2-C-methyl-D-erythritol kinase [Chitinibacteraceae bacterium HSL-7]
MDWQSFPAPAKINLFLHITGRRADGYHLLQSVFQLVDLADNIELRVRSDGEVVHHNPIAGVAPDADLTVRAARLLQRHAGCTLGADIRVEKRIPMGGGLGGGSSDAATVMLALNRLWSLNLSRHELMALGVTLGADVPFFLFGRTAFVEGIGEVMTPVDAPERPVVIARPGVHVPTPAIFAAPDLRRDCPVVKPALLTWEQGENVMEAVAVRLYPALAEVRDWLSQWAPARMSGSGACFFAFTALQGEGASVLSRSPDGMVTYTCMTMSQHPLVSYAD